ncbi:MAG TPA: Lrp/AsnC family transcriptional regulator [Egibacteraceae bacterium]|nr:Lrp/AsnC family transcriptional regulator [Egibacteraceae bacterium]
MRLDDLDRQIIAWLSRDARASFRAIGEAVGLSAPAVKRRVDRLSDEGVIERFTAVINPAALGWSTEAFVELFCTGRTPVTQIRSAVARVPEVVGAYTITGEPDALLHVRASDTAHLEATLEKIRSEPFVVQTRSVVVLTRLLERQVPAVDEAVAE